jgi:hypothetical protein
MGRMKKIIDYNTGEETIIPYTAEEEAEADAMIPGPTIPESITRRQCAVMMLSQNMITGQEAILMTQSGIPPANVQTYFDAMSEPQRTMAIIDFAAINYFRDNPLLAELMAANGMTEQQVDQFFIEAFLR